MPLFDGVSNVPERGRCTRRRCRAAIERADFYQKELDFLILSSYGPGRYDRRYEEEGLDYPVAFVRWTENRNMSEYLRMLNERKVDCRSID